jgi:hypothetical protein
MRRFAPAGLASITHRIPLTSSAIIFNLDPALRIPRQERAAAATAGAVWRNLARFRLPAFVSIFQLRCNHSIYYHHFHFITQTPSFPSACNLPTLAPLTPLRQVRFCFKRLAASAVSVVGGIHHPS